MDRCAAGIRQSSGQSTCNKPFEVGREKSKGDNAVEKGSGQAPITPLERSDVASNTTGSVGWTYRYRVPAGYSGIGSVEFVSN